MPKQRKRHNNSFLNWCLNKFNNATIGAILVAPFFGGSILGIVICTAGLGLFVVIPVLTGIGATFRRLVEIKESDGLVKITNSQQAIINYIYQARQCNLSDQEIWDNLKLQGGWKDEDIKQAFKSITTIQHNI